MAAAIQAPPPISPQRAARLDDGSSGISSPLSDVEDKDGEVEDVMLLNGDVNRPDPSDSDSVLSDVIDTEAETERLFDTPQAQRQKDVIVDQFNQDRVYERTPHLLRRASSVGANRIATTDADADADNDNDNDSLSDDISVLTSQAEEIDSPPKPNKTESAPSGADPRHASRDRKRKRSTEPDQSDSDEPLRKRLGSAAAAAVTEPRGDDEGTTISDGQVPAPPSPGGYDEVGTKETNPILNTDSSPKAVASPARDSSSGKKSTRQSSKRSDDDSPKNGKDLALEEYADIPVDDEGTAGDVEDDVEVASKDAEEGTSLKPGSALSP